MTSMTFIRVRILLYATLTHAGSQGNRIFLEDVFRHSNYQQLTHPFQERSDASTHRNASIYRTPNIHSVQHSANIPYITPPSMMRRGSSELYPSAKDS
jgi:hypothetical protein